MMSSIYRGVIFPLQPQPASSLGHPRCAGQCSVITQDITAGGRMPLWQLDLGLCHNLTIKP